jgi:hypothetical protein
VSPGGAHWWPVELRAGEATPKACRRRPTEQSVSGVALAGELRGLRFVLCPASFMIGGTSGSDTKLCQPCSSQSKMTQTRSSSEGSRKTSALLEPCCLRFSAPVVEKISRKRSKSCTCVVARSIAISFR